MFTPNASGWSRVESCRVNTASEQQMDANVENCDLLLLLPSKKVIMGIEIHTAVFTIRTSVHNSAC